MRARYHPGDRLLLAGLSRLLPRSEWWRIPIRPKTLLRWHRELVRRKWAAFGRRRGPGRPVLPADVRAVVVRLATESPGWGYRRIRGELLKLGHDVSATAIRATLRRHRGPPAPQRGGLAWGHPCGTKPASCWRATSSLSRPFACRPSGCCSSSSSTPGARSWPAAPSPRPSRGSPSRPATWPGASTGPACDRPSSSTTGTASSRRASTRRSRRWGAGRPHAAPGAPGECWGGAMGRHGAGGVPGLPVDPRSAPRGGRPAGVRPVLQFGRAAPRARPAPAACPRASRPGDRGRRPAGSARRAHPRERPARGIA